MRPLPALADVAVVLAFATAGRASHAEGVSVPGVLDTAWPFLVGLGTGWLVSAGFGLPLPGLRAGAVVWGLTLGGGMALRLATGDGAAVPFVVVAAGVLALGLLGWRMLVRGRSQVLAGGPPVQRTPR